MPWPLDEFDDPFEDDEEEGSFIWGCGYCDLVFNFDPGITKCPSCNKPIKKVETYDKALHFSVRYSGQYLFQTTFWGSRHSQLVIYTVFDEESNFQIPNDLFRHPGANN